MISSEPQNFAKWTVEFGKIFCGKLWALDSYHSSVTWKSTVLCCRCGPLTVRMWLFISLLCLSVSMFVSVSLVTEQSAGTARWHRGAWPTVADVGCCVSTQLWHDVQCWQFPRSVGAQVWSAFCSTACFPLSCHAAVHRTFHWKNCMYYQPAWRYRVLLRLRVSDCWCFIHQSN